MPLYGTLMNMTETDPKRSFAEQKTIAKKEGI